MCQVDGGLQVLDGKLRQGAEVKGNGGIALSVLSVPLSQSFKPSRETQEKLHETWTWDLELGALAVTSVQRVLAILRSACNGIYPSSIFGESWEHDMCKVAGVDMHAKGNDLKKQERTSGVLPQFKARRPPRAAFPQPANCSLCFAAWMQMRRRTRRFHQH